jgi:hypothetical protein
MSEADYPKYLESLKSLPDEFDRLAEEAQTDFELYGSSRIRGMGIPPVHKRLIEMKPEVQEFIIRTKSLKPDLAEMVSKDYEQLLGLTKEPGDAELLETHLRTFARGLRRIIQELSKQFAPCLEPVNQAVIAAKTKPTEGNGVETADTHSEDFTSVRWNGKQYQFNKTQARCIELLWNNDSLSEKTIGEKIESAADNFRLMHVFRNRRGKGMNPAWGKMIVKYGKGIFGLNRPAQKSQKNHT